MYGYTTWAGERIGHKPLDVENDRDGFIAFGAAEPREFTIAFRAPIGR